MTTSYARGKEGEKVAALWLRLKGYKILAERYKSPYGEIDLIVQRGKTVAFVEVKHHKSEEAALYAITPRQQERIANAAQIWLQENGIDNKLDYRFDALVIAKGKAPKHITNAWQLN
jgi:putative endonuclease